MNLQEKIEDLRKRTLSDLLSVADEKTLNNLRTVMLGKKGELTEILKVMKDLTNEERPVIGALANAFRDEFGAKFEAKKLEIEQAVMNAALESESLDVTLPGKAQKKGSRHILTQTQEEIEELGDLERLRLVIEYMPDEQLMRVLEKERGKGRDDYPIRAMWNALLAGIVFQHDSDAKLLRELARNGQLRSLCGFNGKVPTPWAFSRFLHKVLMHQAG